MAGRLAGRNALVTGAASGIGAATAALFAAEGARVALCDREIDACAILAERIREAGGGAMEIALDVTDEAQWADAMAAAAGAFGPLDVLMNCAGLYAGGPIESATIEDFDRLVAVNLKGAFLGCREAVRHMKDRPADIASASIINVASTAAFVGTANTSIYTLTKGGVRLLAKAVAVEVAELGYNIRCNSLNPGGTETAMFDHILAERGMTRAQNAGRARARNLLGRMAEPREIANGALFLASDESSFMTGNDLSLDGGYTAR